MLLGLRRVYEKRSPADGRRILVDRLWPRGVKKSTQNVDEWFRDAAPSDALRKWFMHDPSKWDEFRRRYRKELQGNKKLDELLQLIKKSDVTLVYAAKDTEHNNAVALSEFLKEKQA